MSSNLLFRLNLIKSNFNHRLEVGKTTDLFNELDPYKPEYAIKCVVLATVPEKRHERISSEILIHLEFLVEDVSEVEVKDVNVHVLDEH
jgi:hypothetical protein